ncbi:MAG: SLC13 family permease, partial [Anaerolineae bacterium]
NILAAGILQELVPCKAFSFFDFLPMGVIILGGGIAYMALIGRHLLPAAKTERNLTRSYHLRDYATELRVLPDSPLVGKTILESRFGEDYDLTIISKLSRQLERPLSAHVASTRRLTGHTLPVRRTETIKANDTFLVQGKLENILKIKQVQHLEIGADVKLSDADLTTDRTSIAEMVFTPASELVGKTLKEAQFREKFNLTVLALWRAGHPIRRKLANIPLQFGDVLLVQGPPEQFSVMGNTPGLVVLQPVPFETRRIHKAPVALAIMVGLLLVVSMGWLHISVAAVIAAFLMVIFRVISMDEAYRAIQWRSIFLIAGMLPLGIAMQQTDTAQFLADQIIHATNRWGPMGVLLGIYIMTLFLTQPMSNAAATVLVVPIAIDAALSLGVDPHPFVMAVVIAASTAFITPIGHQANVLVYGVGNYKFSDFAKVGLGLNLFYLVLVALVLPRIWPLPLPQP